MTPYLQPLDITINAACKKYIKECSEKHQVRCAMANVRQRNQKNEEVEESINEASNEDHLIISQLDKKRIQVNIYPYNP